MTGTREAAQPLASGRADVLGDLPQTRQELEALIRQIVLDEVQRAAEQLAQKLTQAAAVHALDAVGTQGLPWHPVIRSHPDGALSLRPRSVRVSVHALA